MPDTMNKNLYERIIARQKQLEDARQPHEAVYASVIEMLRPELSRWSLGTNDDTDIDSSSHPGNARNQKTFTGVAQEAVENWSDGMQGHIVSPSIAWFLYRMSQDRFNNLPQVILWKQEVEEAMYALYRERMVAATARPM